MTCLLDFTPRTKASELMREALLPHLHAALAEQGLASTCLLLEGQSLYDSDLPILRLRRRSDFVLEEFVLPRIMHHAAAVFTFRESVRTPKPYDFVIQVHEPLASPSPDLRSRGLHARSAIRSRAFLRQATVLCSSATTSTALSRNGIHCSVNYLGGWPHPVRPVSAPDPVAVVFVSNDRRDDSLVVQQAIDLYRARSSVLRFVTVGTGNPLRGAHHSGWLSRANLQRLLTHSSLYVGQSRHEGFGLQTVEALQSGMSVLLPDEAIHREIAGDAGEYWDSAEDLLRLLLTYDSPSYRLDRRSGAFSQGAQYDWRRCALGIASKLVAVSQRSGANA